MVPFAECIIYVALTLQVVGYGFCRLRHDRVVARESHGCQRVATQADRVRKATGHQCRARRRAKRRGVEVVVAQAVVGECIDVRCINQSTKAANLCETDIVEQENDDIGRPFFGQFFFGPPFLRVGITFSNYAAEAFYVFGFNAGI